MPHKKKGYIAREIDGVIYYFSDYSSFSTPHLSKMRTHVAKRRAALAAKREAKKKIVMKPSTQKAKAPAGASSSTPTIEKEN